MSTSESSQEWQDPGEMRRVWWRAWRDNRGLWWQNYDGMSSWVGTSWAEIFLYHIPFGIWGDISAPRPWLPRWFHHFAASMGGFFWTRCERCGKGWGGQQWNDHQWQTRQLTESQGRAAYCPQCAVIRKREAQVA